MAKKPLGSKKFIAYLLSSVGWKVVIMAILMSSEIDRASPLVWTTLQTIVFIAGFIEAGYIGGQAWLDKYVRLAEITKDK